MPRSLSNAGLTSVPFFVRADNVIGQPFYIGACDLRTNRFGNEEVVLKLRLRDGVYDADGELHKLVWLSLSAGASGQRRDIVKYFQTSNDPLGPCIFTEVPTNLGNPFYRIDDVAQDQLPPPLERIPMVQPRGQSDGGTSLEDIPF
jgi:hypothetical protein